MAPDLLERMRSMPGYLYLGSPYSKFHAGQAVACQLVSKAAANLMKMGLVVLSPIAHSHNVGLAGGIDLLDWEFWKHKNDPLIAGASGMLLLKLEGWEESVGLAYEIAAFDAADKPVVYVEPAEALLW